MGFREALSTEKSSHLYLLGRASKFSSLENSPFEIILATWNFQTVLANEKFEGLRSIGETPALGVHLAKVAFLKYFLRRVRNGESEAACIYLLDARKREAGGGKGRSGAGGRPAPSAV